MALLLYIHTIIIPGKLSKAKNKPLTLSQVTLRMEIHVDAHALQINLKYISGIYQIPWQPYLV